MKILQIIPQLSSGGAERFVVDLCNELSVHHSVTLMVFFPLQGEQAFYLPQVSPKVNVVSMNKHMGADLLLPFRICKFVREWKPDIIHTHLVSVVYASMAILLYSERQQAIRCFHTIHSEAQRESEGGVKRSIRKLLFKTNRVIPVAISKENLCSFERFYGFSTPMIENGRTIPSHIQISPNTAQEIEKIKPTPSSRIVVQLARFNPIKRQALMAKVAKRLYNEGYDFCVLMIGRQDPVDELMSTKAINAPNVILLGERTNPLEYLALADGFGLCSSCEGMPISLIEALGVGVVPICTPVGGIVDVIENEKNGFIATDISETSYYEAMKAFLDTSSADLVTLKQAVKESYKVYDMTHCAQKYEQLYKQ